MPLVLSSASIQEKNKIEGGGRYIILIDINVPGLSDHILISMDNSDTIWNGETYVSFPFEIEEISDAASGEVPRIEVRVSNISRAMEAYIQSYDEYCKLNSYAPIEMVISVINSNNLSETEADYEYYYRLIQPKATPEWMTFTLGASNPFNMRTPRSRLLKNRCRYKEFKGERCGYSGVETTCSRTLVRCRELGNSSRFGGFPGVGRSPIFV